MKTERGFTLAEVLIAMAIIAFLAAVIVPTVLGRLQTGRVNAIIGELQAQQTAIMLFRKDVGRYPGRLDYLGMSALPVGAIDACGVTIGTPNRSRFRGPYVARPIALTGTRYVTATSDTVEALLTRTLVSSQRVLQILMYGPEQTIVEEIDRQVDGALDPSAGIIQYGGTPGPEDYTLRWTFVIPDGAC